MGEGMSTKPCAACGSECRVETFGPSDIIEQAFEVWVCSNNPRFGGDCAYTWAHLQLADWNAAMTPPKETTIIQPALLPCPCCKAPCEVEIDPARSVICEDENGDHYTEHRHAIKTYHYRAAQPAPVEQDVERARDARKLAREIMSAMQRAQFPADYPAEAHDEFEALILTPLLLSTLTPARAEGFKAGLTVIADNLVDQRDEPWTEEGGASQNRVHFWRDKAINASRAIRALKETSE